MASIQDFDESAEGGRPTGRGPALKVTRRKTGYVPPAEFPPRASASSEDEGTEGTEGTDKELEDEVLEGPVPPPAPAEDEPADEPPEPVPVPVQVSQDGGMRTIQGLEALGLNTQNRPAWARSLNNLFGKINANLTGILAGNATCQTAAVLLFMQLRHHLRGLLVRAGVKGRPLITDLMTLGILHQQLRTGKRNLLSDGNWNTPVTDVLKTSWFKTLAECRGPDGEKSPGLKIRVYSLGATNDKTIFVVTRDPAKGGITGTSMKDALNGKPSLLEGSDGLTYLAVAVDYVPLAVPKVIPRDRMSHEPKLICVPVMISPDSPLEVKTVEFVQDMVAKLSPFGINIPTLTPVTASSFVSGLELKRTKTNVLLTLEGVALSTNWSFGPANTPVMYPVTASWLLTRPTNPGLAFPTPYTKEMVRRDYTIVKDVISDRKNPSGPDLALTNLLMEHPELSAVAALVAMRPKPNVRWNRGTQFGISGCVLQMMRGLPARSKLCLLMAMGGFPPNLWLNPRHPRSECLDWTAANLTQIAILKYLTQYKISIPEASMSLKSLYGGSRALCVEVEYALAFGAMEAARAIAANEAKRPYVPAAYVPSGNLKVLKPRSRFETFVQAGYSPKALWGRFLALYFIFESKYDPAKILKSAGVIPTKEQWALYNQLDAEYAVEIARDKAGTAPPRKTSYDVGPRRLSSGSRAMVSPPPSPAVPRPKKKPSPAPPPPAPPAVSRNKKTPNPPVPATANIVPAPLPDRMSREEPEPEPSRPKKKFSAPAPPKTFSAGKRKSNPIEAKKYKSATLVPTDSDSSEDEAPTKPKRSSLPLNPPGAAFLGTFGKPAQRKTAPSSRPAPAQATTTLFSLRDRAPGVKENLGDLVVRDLQELRWDNDD